VHLSALLFFLEVWGLFGSDSKHDNPHTPDDNTSKLSALSLSSTRAQTTCLCCRAEPCVGSGTNNLSAQRLAMRAAGAHVLLIKHVQFWLAVVVVLCWLFGVRVPVWGLGFGVHDSVTRVRQWWC